MADKIPVKASPYTPRTNESQNQQHTRCGRFYHTNNRWFFKTREGFDYGPYANRTECKYAFEEFIELVSNQISLGDNDIEVKDNDLGWKIPSISF